MSDKQRELFETVLAFAILLAVIEYDMRSIYEFMRWVKSL